MRGIYDLPLRLFIHEFEEGWHVLLEADGDAEPTANLGQHPVTGKTEVMSPGAVPLQALTEEDLGRVMVRVVSRNVSKRIVILAVRPELLRGAEPAPLLQLSAELSPKTKRRWVWILGLVWGGLVALYLAVILREC
jgi:hypothetical protein